MGSCSMIYEKRSTSGDQRAAFVALLRTCAKNKDLHRGIVVHDDIVKSGLLQKCSDALIAMYAKCGEFAKAEELLNLHKSRNICSWTAVITGYVRHGQGQNALSCFNRMQEEGLSPNAVTYACVLKACGNIRAAEKGEQIHDQIAREGLIDGDIVLGTALVDMYAKCGAFEKARQMLDELPARDVISWNAIIAGYAKQGQDEQALDCFEQMQGEGLSPNTVTFACILKSCGSIGAVDKGEKIHDEIAKDRLLENDLVLGNALVHMYAKCGALVKAQQVLDELPARDVVSWNAMIAGYVQQSQAEQALKCWKAMREDRLFPDTLTYVCLLKACGMIGAVNKGKQIHEEIGKRGLLGDSIALGTALVDMYAKCGALLNAALVLEELPARDITCWNALITGYSQQGYGEKVLSCLEGLHHEGLCPNAVTFSCVLKACGSIKATEKGEEIHEEIARRGLLGSNDILETALVYMYVKCGAFASARKVLDEFLVQNVMLWSALITGYVEQGQGEQALNCYEQMLHEGLSPNTVIFTCILKACGNLRAVEKGKHIHEEISKQGLLADDVLCVAIVDMYAKCGAFTKAQEVLEEFLVQDVVSWNTLIAEYTEQGHGEEALSSFKRMQQVGPSPDATTFTCILKACASTGACERGEESHHEMIRQGLLGSNVVLSTALVDMYAKCGALSKARLVLEELPIRNSVSWSALIAGYAQQGQGEQALSCFEQMKREGLFPDEVTLSSILKACSSVGAPYSGEQIHEEIAREGLLGKNIMLSNALVGMYAKCGALDKARQVLEELPARDLVSWNSLIAGYAKHGQGEQALNCVEKMEREGLSPDSVTFACLLKACGSIGAADKGDKIHDEIVRQGLLGDKVELGTALVDMYAKCGALAKAARVLEGVPNRSLSSWNALITGYARQGLAKQALSCCKHMLHAGFSPNPLTFSSLLSACNHSSLLEDARMCFVDMSTNYSMEPDMEHYTCMIALLGGAGHLDKAVGLVQDMPQSDNSVLWSGLLGACRKWGNIESARWAYEHAVK